ncbi:hypothetical protein SRHO_G00283250 [Serrasalmus rhombeus]
MSLTTTTAEGVTTFTVTSNPKSKWPLLCQLLGNLCYSPVCSVSQSLKQKMGRTHTVLGFIVAGIVCILAEKFPSSCLLSLTGLVNLVSAALAITATVFYSIDLGRLPGRYNCNQRGYSYGYGYENTTASQIKYLMENCEHNQHIFKMVYGGLEILLIVLAVLQLCVTVSSCVLILKTLCKKKKGDEMEDPELRQPLVEEDLSSSAY